MAPDSDRVVLFFDNKQTRGIRGLYFETPGVVGSFNDGTTQTARDLP